MSRSTRIALALYWENQARDLVATVFHQVGILADPWDLDRDTRVPILDDLRELLLRADGATVLGLLSYMARSSGELRARINPRYRHDQPWAELERHVELDGYRLDPETGCVPLETPHGEFSQVRDDLMQALENTQVPGAEDVREALRRSEAAYVLEPFDYNACLNDARVALQSLARSIAEQRQVVVDGNFDPTVWGQVLAYLRTSGLITEQEEQGLSGAFTFLSPGSHRLVGVSEREMARLGRSIALSMVYFLLRTAEADTGTAAT